MMFDSFDEMLIRFLSHSLTDVDECAKNNGNCDQMCENSPGSYQCKCRSGFSLDADKHTCNGKSSKETEGKTKN